MKLQIQIIVKAVIKGLPDIGENSEKHYSNKQSPMGSGNYRDQLCLHHKEQECYSRNH
jgi:hypothetical protein